MPVPPILMAPALAAVPHLVAARTDRPPHIDGRLDDPAWAVAPASDRFTQKIPDEARRPSERTTIRILYDDRAVYVGIDCDQRRAPIVAHLTRRDRTVETDWVSVALDTRSEGKSAFEFMVTAAGVLLDGIYYNDTDFTRDWDENWDARIVTTSRGWSAEFELPLRILRFAARPVQSWGLEVRRYISARQETDEWAFVPRDVAGEVSHYGRLDGLVGLRPKPSLEVRPFVVARMRHSDPQGDTVERGTKLEGSLGVDLRWHPTQDLTLDATINPDFGQVEADQVILNLTTYETFYPEKRPFFLEGVDTFATPIQLLYTRRIGHAPATPTLRDSDQLVRAPEPTAIYGAAKLTGDLGDHFSVGELLAVTGQQESEVQRPDGTRYPLVVDPTTSYKVLRIKRMFGESSSLGAMVTATNRVEPTDAYPIVRESGRTPYQLCPGGEQQQPLNRCFHDAYTGGVDGLWRSPGGDYVARAQLIATLMEQGPPRTLPDGTVIGPGDASGGGTVSVAKEGGKHWIGGGEYTGTGRRVDYNDVGFMKRQNLHSVSAFVGYRTLDPWSVLLDTTSRLEVYDQENLDFVNLARGVQVNTYWKFKNYWHLWTEAHVRPAHFDDREIGDGAALERAGLVGYEIGIDTDSRKPIVVGAYAQAQRLDDGVNFYAEGTLTLHPLPELDVDLLPTFLYSNGEPRYVTSESNAYVFGRLRARAFGLTLRSTYSFTPRLTLQAYAQAFVAAEHYSDFRGFPIPVGGPPRTIRIGDLQPIAAPSVNPDYEEGDLNANIVWRWEYTLGSTLFFVYTHAQTGRIQPDFTQPTGLRLRLVSPRVAADIFLVKLSYWWG